MNSISRRQALAGLGALSMNSLLRSANVGLSQSTPSDLAARSHHPTTLAAEAEQLRAYFAGIAPHLLRTPEGILQHPSIAITLPGKAYSTELWDWDTLWTTHGLMRLARISKDDWLLQKAAEHAKGSLFNFLDHQSPEGRVPIMMKVSDPDPFGCLKLTSPSLHNQAKPVFGQLGILVSDAIGTVDWLAPYFDRLLLFYRSWSKNNKSSVGLFVWGDDVAIGDDNDPTTFGRPDFSSANLMLNCLFYKDLKSASELARRLNRPEDAQKLSIEAASLGKTIQTHCWEPRDSFYYTVDTQCVDKRAERISNSHRGMDMSWHTLRLRVQMFTGFLPLWCGLATSKQAHSLIQTNYLRDNRFRAPWGVRSLSSQEEMYSLEFSSNPSNWLGPIWIIVDYFVWSALRNYGFHEAATDLATKTIRLLNNDLAVNGSLNEYYHPDTGAPLSHPGFIDWNMLILEML